MSASQLHQTPHQNTANGETNYSNCHSEHLQLVWSRNRTPIISWLNISIDNNNSNKIIDRRRLLQIIFATFGAHTIHNSAVVAVLLYSTCTAVNIHSFNSFTKKK